MGEERQGDREQERDDSVPDRVPAADSTGEQSEAEEKKKDATVDHVSEQSMDGSDPPAW